jgi:NADH:ubiquinone oxidoreductase subunit F (NADH-binding)
MKRRNQGLLELENLVSGKLEEQEYVQPEYVEQDMEKRSDVEEQEAMEERIKTGGRRKRDQVVDQDVEDGIQTSGLRSRGGQGTSSSKKPTAPKKKRAKHSEKGKESLSTVVK